MFIESTTGTPFRRCSETLYPPTGWGIQASTDRDVPQIRAYFNGLNQNSRRLRLQSTTNEVPEDVIRLFEYQQGSNRQTLILKELESNNKVAGECILYRVPDSSDAEIALSIDDQMQGKGFGKALMMQLIQRALNAGVQYLYADTLRENKVFIGFAHAMGFTSTKHPDDWLQLRLWMELER